MLLPSKWLPLSNTNKRVQGKSKWKKILQIKGVHLMYHTAHSIEDVK